MYISIYVCMCVCVPKNVFKVLRGYVCMHVRKVYMYVCTCVYVKYVCMYIYTSICMQYNP